MGPLTLLSGALLTLLAASLSGVPPAGRPSDPRASARDDGGGAFLDAHREGASLVLTARFEAPPGVAPPFRYSLEVTREGRSRSTSRQSGHADAAPGAAVVLATSHVTIADGDRVVAVLTVSDPSGVVGTARFSTGDAP